MKKLELKEKTWYNFGDVNHREYGGTFVRKFDDEIEVIKVINNEENHAGKGYTMSYRSDYIEDMEKDFEALKNGQSNPVASFADWNQLIDNGIEGLTLLFWLAISHIDYYGGSSEYLTDTNYWRLLKRAGITPKNIH